MIFAAEIFVSPLEASIGLMSSFVSFRVEFKSNSSTESGTPPTIFGQGTDSRPPESPGRTINLVVPTYAKVDQNKVIRPR